jgi:protein-disulfide isomerase
MSESKQFELTAPMAIIIAGIIVAGAILFTNVSNAGPLEQQPSAELPASVAVKAPSAEDHIIGSPTAPLVLIEYSDFECPFCSRVHPTLQKIASESNGQIAWVYRHLPLESIHPEAEPAALASECIFEQLGNEGFWKFADQVFGDQSKIGSAYYAQIAKDLGANMSQFNSCVATKKYASKIDAQAQEAMSNGGNGTPFTVVYGNGKQVPVSGALPYAQFMSVIKTVQERQ